MNERAQEFGGPKVHASGLKGVSYLYYIEKHLPKGLILVPSEVDLATHAAALATFSGSPVLSFPALEHVYAAARPDPEALLQRLKTQAALVCETAPRYVIAHAHALTQKTISPERLLDALVSLKKGDWVERDRLITDLLSIGYRRDELAEDPGFFSVRGHLVDVFSPYESNPFRIEFFGDEIISLRNFDPDTQRSLEEKESISISPIREVIITAESFANARRAMKDLSDSIGVAPEERDRLLTSVEQNQELVDPRWILPAFEKSFATLLDYLPKNFPLISLDEDAFRLESSRESLEEDQAYRDLKRLCFPPEELRAPLEDLIPLNSPQLSRLSTSVLESSLHYDVSDLSELRERLLKAKSFLPIAELVRSAREASLSVEIIYSTAKRREALQDALGSLNAEVTWKFGFSFPGFRSSTFSTLVLNERDIFGAKKPRRQYSRASKDYLRQFSELSEGDYVIHEEHGISRYRGLQKLEIQGVVSEFILLEFAENDKLYLPIYKVDRISRYASDGLAHPKLDRLGSHSFQKRKIRIREDILEIAHELLELAAVRKLQKVERPDFDRAKYDRFCQAFEYDLTSDQEASVQEIERDLKSPMPMDRLVCGDVGFGKTEVALRAAMMAVLRGQQVAVLAPTTLLVEQHARSFKKRMESFGVRVAHLSRFISATDQARVLKAVKAGEVDILVGTHRLLQTDIGFLRLGLIIVDEEQRFGVKQKERLKKLKATADILTLSATPIPRTLQISIFGIRDLSLITTPPENRQPIKTFVGIFDEGLIKTAIQRELGRGGQVLIVHNRVETIQTLADRVQRLVPEAKILVAHGQMPEDELESKVRKFIDQEVQVLIATSIVENGLDIPNVNTLIVDRSELFGLSNLYQIRGRVGRSHRSAYAYFLVREETQLTPEATKRLEVIRTNTELGSGFNVANHDLEIRGAGNLLGEQQSGVIAEVGLEFYTELLHETLAEIKQGGVPQRLPELTSGYTAYIPESYIPDASVRISTYKRLDKAVDLPQLVLLEEEILDRFGVYPVEVENLCHLLRLRIQAYQLGCQGIEVFPGRLSLQTTESTKISTDGLVKLLKTVPQMNLDPKGKLSFQFKSQMKEAASNENVALRDFKICREFLERLSKTTATPN